MHVSTIKHFLFILLSISLTESNLKPPRGVGWKQWKHWRIEVMATGR